MLSSQSDISHPHHSTFFRLPFALVLLLLFFSFSACSPLVDQSASSRNDLAPAPEKITKVRKDLAEPEQDELTAPEQQNLADAEPDDLTELEPETTVNLEVEELKNSGDWKEGTLQSQQVGENVEYDFPVTMNRQVEFYLDFFQNKQPKIFARWLSRSGRYLPMIKKHLQEAGLPSDLCYLPMIESGYSLTATSTASAVGPWQFIQGTGKDYGLTIDSYVDERRDPEKATRAAISYLSTLYAEFGSWHLAVAAYNAGEGTIRKAIRNYNTNNFWELAGTQYLQLETKRYVPKLIAAIMIAKEPEKYGFTDIEYLSPLTYDTVEVPRWTSLEAVSLAGNVPFEDLRELNRHLRKAITPPDEDEYTIKVPVGKKEVITKNLPNVRAIASTEYKTHVVATGETITRICKKYNLGKITLLKANNLRAERLAPGQRLRIPYQTTSYKIIPQSQWAALKKGKANLSSDNVVLHTIKSGETLDEISKRYNVSTQMIATWNNLKDLHRIKAGQQLALYVQSGVKDTESKEAGTAAAANIASKQQRPAKDVRAGVDSKTRRTYYKVKGGDTISSIAKRYNISPREIRKLNQLEDDTIYPGLTLLLELALDIDS